jgi:DNA-binding SARP family transcriptional activator
VNAAVIGGPVLAAWLLGTFRLAIDGIAVDVRSSRRIRHVLAYLLTHRRRAVPRDVLMDVFWPAAAPTAARNSLHVTLSGVRQALRAVSPAVVIERRFDAYRIAGSISVWLDVEQFELSRDEGVRAERRGDMVTAQRCYEAACHLYDGDFLADEPYAEWAGPVREALRLAAIDVQSRLMEIYIERTDYAPAAILGRRILATDPCNERIHRRLMTCYAATDQRHLALVQYHRLVDALWTGLRTTPAPETTELFQRLRRRSVEPGAVEASNQPAWRSKFTA